VALVGDDAGFWPRVPAWLKCGIPVVPHSLLCVSASDDLTHRRESAKGSRERREERVAIAEAWPGALELLTHDGWIEVESQPRTAIECVSLLETGTRVREMQAPVAADQREVDLTAVDMSAVLRMVLFASTQEAARRALLLFLVTWDPLYGAASLLRMTGLTSGLFGTPLTLDQSESLDCRSEINGFARLKANPTYIGLRPATDGDAMRHRLGYNEARLSDLSNASCD
jgi:hypothetical protein